MTLESVTNKENESVEWRNPWDIFVALPTQVLVKKI
jgi:hypothetical protein